MLAESIYDRGIELPRRYHRPPAVKRRKSRRSGPTTPYEAGVSPEGGVPAGLSAEESSDEEWEEEGEEYEEEPAPVAAASEARPGPDRVAAHHIQRDYSYVRSELTRIAVLAVILLAALLVVAVLR